MSHCRQILALMMDYAAENNGQFPDAVTSPITGSLPFTSNDAFRALFQDGSGFKDEKIFGSPNSPFTPDGKIGSAPKFEQALQPGENHWAMTAGQSNTSTSIMPLVFESPVDASWPPKWNCDEAGRAVQGRAWPGGKVVVGLNDTSVDLMKLQSAQGAAVAPALVGNGVDPFTNASEGVPQKVLNIAVP